MENVVAGQREYQEKIRPLPPEEQRKILAEIADSVQSGMPPRENRRQQRTVDVVSARGNLESIQIVVHGVGAYLQTGLIQAFAAHHLVYEPPRAVGFASPCTAFGHRELLAALEAYGMVRMKIRRLMPLHRLDHVLVLTDDLEATKAFYCDVLGFEVGERPPLEFPGYWLYLDGFAVPARRRARGVRGPRGAARPARDAGADRPRRIRGAATTSALVARLDAGRRRGGVERRARRGLPPALPRRSERRPDRAQRQPVATPAAASGALPRIRSAAFSAIMIVAACVFARVIVGITEASTTRSPSTP